MSDWEQIPAVMFQHLIEKLPRRVEAVTNFLLMPLVLKPNVQQAHMSMVFGRPHFGHVVQGWVTPVLESRCPAEFNSISN